MSTVLAQSSAYLVQQGFGSIGPFLVPSGASGVSMVIQRTNLPAVPGLLTVTCLESFDNGATFAPVVSAFMTGEPIVLPDGSALATTHVGFRFSGAPTNIRIDVQAAQAFTADFEVLAL